MKKHILHGGIHRIGDRPEHMIDNERFLGRDPLDELWMSKKEPAQTKVKREANAIILEIALPGYRKESLKVEVRNHLLNIRAFRPAVATKVASDKKQQAGIPDYIQTYQLPGNIELERISARYRQGVLRIRLPLEKERLTSLNVHVS